MTLNFTVLTRNPRCVKHNDLFKVISLMKMSKKIKILTERKLTATDKFQNAREKYKKLDELDERMKLKLETLASDIEIQLENVESQFVDAKVKVS